MTSLLDEADGGLAASDKPKQSKDTKSLTSYEAWDYARLKMLEVRGYEEQEELRKAPKMTAAAIVAFINQLSPWDLKSTGISILEAYVEQQGGRTDLVATDMEPK